jgi:uroporphyrinogen decarboxylase
MTPRERIIKALKHEETDRVPVDLGSTESSGITWRAYNRLKKHLGIGGDTFVFDLAQLIAKVDIKIAEIVGSDAVPLLFEPLKWKSWEFDEGVPVKIPAGVNLKKLPDGSTLLVRQEDNNAKDTVLARLPVSGFYFDAVFNPLGNINQDDDLKRFESFFESFDLPGYLDEGFERLSVRAKNLHSQTDFAVVGNLWVHIIAAGQSHRGFENFMVDLAVNKKLAHRILSKQLDFYLERIDRYCRAIGGNVDVIQVNDDLGTQNGPQISLHLYREMIKPYHKELWGYIKEKCGKPILFHSCGSVYNFIPDLIECGIDALNPIQVSAKNMDTAALKKEFGRYITFWGGGCDTQKILPFGTPEQVAAEVKKRVADLADGGGFVFCQVHNIQPDVPVENILAMYRQLGTLKI